MRFLLGFRDARTRPLHIAFLLYGGLTGWSVAGSAGVVPLLPDQVHATALVSLGLWIVERLCTRRVMARTLGFQDGYQRAMLDVQKETLIAEQIRDQEQQGVPLVAVGDTGAGVMQAVRWVNPGGAPNGAGGGLVVPIHNGGKHRGE